MGLLPKLVSGAASNLLMTPGRGSLDHPCLASKSCCRVNQRSRMRLGSLICTLILSEVREKQSSEEEKFVCEEPVSLLGTTNCQTRPRKSSTKRDSSTRAILANLLLMALFKSLTARRIW